jgi:hypothetical protein
VKILKGSNMFLEVLEGHVQSYVEANGMATSQRSNSNQPTNVSSSADDESAAAEAEKGRQQLQEQDMADEREEEKAEESPTTTAAPSTFNRKAGEVADPKQNLLMDLFNIPSDNMQTLTQLHKELTHTIQKQNSINGPDVLCDGSTIYEDGRHTKLFVEIPKGKSKATFIKLRNIVVRIVKHCTDNDEGSLRQGAVKVIEGLKSEFKESFFEVATSKGYSTIVQAGVMSAEYWTAMAEAVNLRTTQQRLISRFLFHHFGHRVVVPQRELVAYGSQYVTFETFQRKESFVFVWRHHRVAGVLPSATSRIVQQKDR